jgi:tetratricopeptide (TPR) repeat protein
VAETSAASSEIRRMRHPIAVDLRDYDDALRFAESQPEAGNAQFGFECRAADRGFALELKGEAAAAKAELARALETLDRYARGGHGTESNFHSLRGRVLASLGRSEEALREGRLALTLRPATADAWIRQYRLYDLVVIEIRTGQHDAAIAHLGELLAQPSDQASVDLLRLSPVFDPLREHPGFVKLTAR